MVAEGGEGENPAPKCGGGGARAATITPNPLTLGGAGWFPKAVLYSPMRGGVPVFAPAFQPLGRVWGPGQQASEPCIPAA